MQQNLAIANVPMQQYRRLIPQGEALARGTMFQELEKPLRMKKGGARNGQNG